MSRDSTSISTAGINSARDNSATPSQSQGKSYSPEPGTVSTTIAMVLVFLVFACLAACANTTLKCRRRRRGRDIEESNRTRVHQYSDADGDVDLEAVRRAVEARRIENRPWVGMAWEPGVSGVRHAGVLTGDGRERRGRLERNRREGGRTVIVPRRTETRPSLPKYTERDEGRLRVPEYDRMSLPEYESSDLERPAWLEETRSDGRFGEVEVNIQVLERAVLRGGRSEA